MKKKIDELINDYVDGNLESSEVEELNNLLSQNPESVTLLKAHKIVDAHLKQMEYESAPENIAAKIINKIGSTFKSELPKSYFLQGLIGFFGVFLGGLIVYFFTYFSSSDKNYKNSEVVISKIQNVLNDIVGKLTGHLVDVDMMLAVSVVSLIVMLSFYFLYESNKTFRKKLHSTAR